jgi:hypothetical protein
MIGDHEVLEELSLDGEPMSKKRTHHFHQNQKVQDWANHHNCL